jgi:hypothetical protein
MNFNRIIAQLAPEDVGRIVDRKFNQLNDPQFDPAQRENFYRLMDKFFWGEGSVSIEDFSAVAPQLVLNYLQLTHTHYLNVQLPIIAAQIAALVQSLPSNSQVRLIQQLFSSYAQHLREHIEMEESELFWVVDRLLNSEDKFCRISNSSFLAKFFNEHTDTEAELGLILDLLDVTPCLDVSRISILKQSIFVLVKDLHIHHVLEEQVLIPLVLSRF